MSGPVLLLVVVAALPGWGPGPHAAADTAGTGAIRGVVRGGAEGREAPLSGAYLELLGPGPPRSAFTDDAGRYRWDRVPAGTHRVRATLLGYRPLDVEVLVPAGGTVTVDLTLRLRPVELEGVVVEGERPGLVPREDLRVSEDVAELRIRSLEGTPGLAESGLAEVARRAGGGDPGDPSDLLFIRGSTADLKLVLLDGAPVYAPFHLGGILESYDPGSLGSATLYSGGAPARYSGGLSYVLELETRTPRGDRVRSSGALDLVGARATVEAPAGSRIALLASGRALHGLDRAVWGAERSPSAYLEGLVRLDGEVADGHRVAATAFANREGVALDFPGTTLPGEARWSNRAVSAGYRGRIGGTRLATRIAGSRYAAGLPLADSAPRFIEGITRRLRWTLDAAHPVGSSAEIRFGASLRRTDVEMTVGELPPGGAPELRGWDVGSAGGYGEARLPLAEGLRLRAGLRTDRFSGESGLRFSPRASVGWIVGDRATLTLAGGAYHQHVRAPLGAGEEEPGVAPGTTPVVSAHHVRLSLDQELVPGVRLGLDGFLKGFRDVPGVTGGRVNASGVDLRILGEGDALAAWLGYSLTWYWAAEGREVPTGSFAGHHLLTGGVSGRITSSIGFDVRAAYSDRLPYAAVPAGTEVTGPGPPADDGPGGELDDLREQLQTAGGFTGGPGDGFLRVDAEVYGILRPEWGGRTVELRPYLRLLNALDRRDALFYYLDVWRDDEARPLAERALLPVVGLAWRF